MKKTVYTVSRSPFCRQDLLAETEEETVGLCAAGFRRFFRVPTMPCKLVVTDVPTRSPSALAVRAIEDSETGEDHLEIRYPELGAASKVERITAGYDQIVAVNDHLSADGWAYVWVEVES